MATQDELNHLVGKAVNDPAFRKEMLADPEEAAKGMGISLTSEQVEQIKKVDADKMAEAVEDMQSKSSTCCFVG